MHFIFLSQSRKIEMNRDVSLLSHPQQASHVEMAANEFAGDAGATQAFEGDENSLSNSAGSQSADDFTADDGANDPTDSAEERIKCPEGIIRHRPFATNGMAQDFMHGSHGVGGMRFALHQDFLTVGCDEAQKIHMESLVLLPFREQILSAGAQRSHAISNIRRQHAVHHIHIGQRGVALGIKASQMPQKGGSAEKGRMMAGRPQEEVLRIGRLRTMATVIGVHLHCGGEHALCISPQDGRTTGGRILHHQLCLRRDEEAYPALCQLQAAIHGIEAVLKRFRNKSVDMPSVAFFRQVFLRTVGRIHIHHQTFHAKLSLHHQRLHRAHAVRQHLHGITADDDERKIEI